MTQLLKEAIDALSALENLPEEEQRGLAAEVLELVESAKVHHEQAGAETTSDHRPIWERIAERSNNTPDEAWNALPIDGAAEIDHYIYGIPKRNT